MLNQVFKLFCLDRLYFEQYNKYIIINDNTYNIILEQIKLIYLHTNKTSILKEDLIQVVLQITKEQHYFELINKIYSIEIEQDYIDIILQQIKNRFIVYSLNKETNDKIQQEKFEEISSLSDILLLREEEQKTTIVPSTLNLEELNENRKGYNWPITALTNHLGLLPDSTFGLIAARVEVGKTAFILNCILCFLSQQARVLHFNNEDPITKILERYYILEYQQPKNNILINISKCAEKFIEKYKDKLLIYDITEIPLDTLDSIIKKESPDVVVIDQVDPLAKDIDPMSLELMYRKLRQIAKKRETRIIGVTQASAIQQVYLKLDDLHGSKVGKQGSLDYLIGIGMDQFYPEKRYFSLPKNKLTGDHSKFVVHYKPELMKYVE